MTLGFPKIRIAEYHVHNETNGALPCLQCLSVELQFFLFRLLDNANDYCVLSLANRHFYHISRMNGAANFKNIPIPHFFDLDPNLQDIPTHKKNHLIQIMGTNLINSTAVKKISVSCGCNGNCNCRSNYKKIIIDNYLVFERINGIFVVDLKTKQEKSISILGSLVNLLAASFSDDGYQLIVVTTKEIKLYNLGIYFEDGRCTILPVEIYESESLLKAIEEKRNKNVYTLISLNKLENTHYEISVAAAHKNFLAFAIDSLVYVYSYFGNGNISIELFTSKATVTDIKINNDYFIFVAKDNTLNICYNKRENNGIVQWIFLKTIRADTDKVELINHYLFAYRFNLIDGEVGFRFDLSSKTKSVLQSQFAFDPQKFDISKISAMDISNNKIILCSKRVFVFDIYKNEIAVDANTTSENEPKSVHILGNLSIYLDKSYGIILKDHGLKKIASLDNGLKRVIVYFSPLIPAIDSIQFIGTKMLMSLRSPESSYFTLYELAPQLNDPIIKVGNSNP